MLPAQARATPDWQQPWPLLVAILAGLAHTLSFAPTPYGGWLEIATLTWFYTLIAYRRTLCATLVSACAFGFSHFASGVFWLYISMHVYGGMPAIIALTALILFALYLAAWPTLAAALWYFCSATRSDIMAAPPSIHWRSSLAFASAWALSEWLRGVILTGFPWLASGYAQVAGPFAGYAAVIGVYGVGWLLAFNAALIGQMLIAAFKRGKWVLSAPLIIFVTCITGGSAATKVAWTNPAPHAPLTVRLLQGNVQQEIKFEQQGVDMAIALYQELITAQPADLIITPETGIPVLEQDIPESFAYTIRDFADKTGSAIIFGAAGATLTPTGPVDLTNSLFGVTPRSPILYRYDKHHLVPFGEFIPWGFHWFVALMKIPLGDFARGPAIQQPFFVGAQPLALNICYEDIFGEEIARTLRQTPIPAGILVNATNLAWFGDTIALDQHLQIAQMRALETGRPVLRATNTGATAIIGYDGRVEKKLTTFSIGSLEARVQGRVGVTPYITYGNMPVLVVSLLLLAIFAAQRIKMLYIR
nr:apolipoprotein N-acyltransferase [Mycoavidus sp. B2-EB]